MTPFRKSPEAKAADAERLQWSMQAEYASTAEWSARHWIRRGLNPKRLAKVLRALASVLEAM